MLKVSLHTLFTDYELWPRLEREANMNTAREIFQSIYAIAMLLSFLPALWIAGRIILPKISEGGPFGAESPERNHRTHLIYWIALGGFFTLPIIDLLRLSYFLLQIAFPGLVDSAVPVGTIWGRAPWNVFNLLQFVAILVIYAFALSYVHLLGEQISLPGLGVIHLTGFQRICLMLGIGGLVNQLAEGVVAHIVWLNIPLIHQQISAGLVGILGSWVVGILLLILIYLTLSSRLYSSEDEGLTQ